MAAGIRAASPPRSQTPRPTPIQRRVLAAIEGLLDDPPHGDITRITATDTPEWRLRVGDWRIRFTRDPDPLLIVIQRVLPRGRAYRDT